MTPYIELLALVAGAVALAGCTDCDEHKETGHVEIPRDCTVGRCAAWRTGPCKDTCAAFLPNDALAVTGCKPPVPSQDDPTLLVVECTYESQSCTTTPSFGSGRPQAAHRPRGPVSGEDPVGLFFAACAEAEESSVHAFREVAGAVLRFGLAPHLAARCCESAEDEERHRAVMTRLARLHGASPSRAPAAPSAWRTAVEAATENAMAGTIEERWSAALTVYAAHHARSAEIRAALVQVAIDEAAHAELADDLARALDALLDTNERRLVDEARAQAIASLAGRMLHVDDVHPLVEAGILPPRAVRARLFAIMFGPREVCRAA